MVTKRHLSATLALALAFGGFAPAPLRADDTKSTNEYMEDESFRSLELKSGELVLTLKANGWFTLDDGKTQQKGQATPGELAAVQKGNLAQFDIESIKSDADRLREGGFIARPLSTRPFTITIEKVMQVEHQIGPATFETHRLEKRTFSSRGRVAVDPTLARIADALFGIADRATKGSIYGEGAKTLDGKIGYSAGDKDTPPRFTLTTDDGKTIVLDRSDWNPYAKVLDDAVFSLDGTPDPATVIARVKKALGGDRISVRGLVSIENDGVVLKPVRPIAAATTASGPSKTRGILGRVSDAQTP